MPFVRIGYLEGQYRQTDLPSISKCILDALVDCFDVPQDDYFQVFHAHKDGEFYYNRDYLTGDRSDKLLYIQVTCGPGRSTDQKRNFYKRLAELLSAQCNVSQADVFVVLSETEVENWSFGKGVPTMTSRREGAMQHPPIHSNARQLLGDFAPAFAEYTDDVLFGDVWRRSELSMRERSLVTVSALVAGQHLGQLPFHLKLAKQNGLSDDELIAVITHLAFYSGWPRAASALEVAKQVLKRDAE